MEPDVVYYRIVDADYAIVGLRTEIGLSMKTAINALRRDGIRTGAVMLAGFDTVSQRVANLLAQVKAIGVFEFAATRSRFADVLAAAFEGAAREPEWLESPFVPRIYSAVLASRTVALQESHLIGVVKTMQVYGPNRVLLTASGAAKPAPESAFDECSPQASVAASSK